MSPITTHVLDVSRGRPAAGVAVHLEHKTDEGWKSFGSKTTDEDGRVKDLLPEGVIETGSWKITFDTGSYFDSHGVQGFYPEASIVFTVTDGAQHFHVPLLLSPYGFSTYRGS